MMRFIVKKIIDKVYAPYLTWYLKRNRMYKHSGISLVIRKGVFHPAFFYSTKFLLQSVRQLILLDKTLLELGAGSGLIAFYAAKRGAKVTATDINPEAIIGLEHNKQQLQLPIEIVTSDLFDELPARTFDYIIINPPYYPKNPTTNAEKAWYCGEDFGYYKKLFLQLGAHLHDATKVVLSLSEDCDVNYIKEIASIHGFHFHLLKRKRIMWEWNYLFLIQKK